MIDNTTAKLYKDLSPFKLCGDRIEFEGSTVLSVVELYTCKLLYVDIKYGLSIGDTERPSSERPLLLLPSRLL